MAADFRDLLVELERSERFGRWFDTIKVGGTFEFSVQASDAHECLPFETLDDLRQYEAFEVAIKQNERPLNQPGYGAWEELQHKPWASRFKPGMYDAWFEAGEVPTALVQEIYEDLLTYSMAHP